MDARTLRAIDDASWARERASRGRLRLAELRGRSDEARDAITHLEMLMVFAGTPADPHDVERFATCAILVGQERGLIIPGMED